MADQPEIVFARRGAAGLVILDRPAALNAVTHRMVRLLRSELERWRTDPEVTRVVVTAAGDRAFSAGGDLRGIYECGRTGRQSESLAFWRDEYVLNHLIRHYPKPYVALIDGIVMGGGAGVSIHGSHRVAGDRFRFAMPEAGIGFFPDIGATWFLPRMPGQTGTWCALTGERLNGDEAVATGLATHRIASVRFPELCDALCGNEPVGAALRACAGSAPDAVPDSTPHLAHRAAIDRLFAADSVEAILTGLDAEAGSGSPEAEWSRATAAAIRTKAPLSLKIALAQMRRGRNWSLAACLKAEYRIVSRVAYGEDFYEGIRAVIIDKDNRPRWRPAALADVTAQDVERYFSPVPDELVLT